MANNKFGNNNPNNPSDPANRPASGRPDTVGDTDRSTFRGVRREKNTNKLVTGIFKNRLAAQAAIDVLMQQGYGQNDISLLMTDSTRTKEFGIESGNKSKEGAGVGGVVGGSVGAVIAAIAAIGTTLAIPGLGIVVAGPLAAALAGAGAGGAAGSLVGALVGAGIPEHRAKVYDAGLRQGGILVGVEVRSDEEGDALEKLLESRGGMQSRASRPAKTARSWSRWPITASR
jgi:hypothetical protein